MESLKQGDRQLLYAEYSIRAGPRMKHGDGSREAVRRHEEHRPSDADEAVSMIRHWP